MTSEDQINKGLASNSGSASESAEELYPDSPTNISDTTGALRDKKTSTKQGLYPSKPSKQITASNYSRPPFRTACSLLISDRENVNRQATITQMITI